MIAARYMVVYHSPSIGSPRGPESLEAELPLALLAARQSLDLDPEADVVVLGPERIGLAEPDEVRGAEFRLEHHLVDAALGRFPPTTTSQFSLAEFRVGVLIVRVAVVEDGVGRLGQDSRTAASVISPASRVGADVVLAQVFAARLRLAGNEEERHTLLRGFAVLVLLLDLAAEPVRGVESRQDDLLDAAAAVVRSTWL